MTTYCAPCLADLALVREAATSVNGTASCMAHAVLLAHPADDPQRRRARLAQLRDTANEKMATAGPEEQVRLELLVEEYSLASAMESLVPRRRQEGDGTALSRSARKRRGRDRERGEGQPGGGRPDGRPDRGRGQGGPATGAPGGAVADGGAEQVGAEALGQVGAPSGEPPAPASSAQDGAATTTTSGALPGDAASPSSDGGASSEAPAASGGDVPAPVPARDDAPASATPAPLSMAGEAAPVQPVPSTPPPAVDGAVPSPPSAPAGGDQTSSG